MHARAHVILFSSDLTLSYGMVIDYYGLRFQIEIVPTRCATSYACGRTLTAWFVPSSPGT